MPLNKETKPMIVAIKKHFIFGNCYLSRFYMERHSKINTNRKKLINK